MQCYLIWFHKLVYWSDLNHIGPYQTYIQGYKWCRMYILVYTSLWYITVYDGIWRYMTVYDVPGKYIHVYTIMNGVYGCLLKVYQGIFQYTHACNLTNWFVSCCTRPADPPESCKSAAATSQHKTHSSSSTIVFTFCIFCFFRPAPRPAWQGLAWQWRQWAGPLPARRCTCRILRPAAIHVVTPTIFT